MKFEIKAEIFDKFPNAHFGALLIEDILITDSSRIQNLLTNICEDIQTHGQAYHNTPNIQRWLKVFTALGINTKDNLPSHASLLNRARKGKLPSINPLVDIYNSVSLNYLTPIGGHNVKNIKRVTVGRTAGNEKFLLMNTDKEEIVPAGEFAYIDDQNRVLTKNLVWRQSDYSKTTETTNRLFIPIDDIPGIFTDSQLQQIAIELISILAEIASFRYEFKIVSKFNREISLETSTSGNIIKKSTLLLKRPAVVTDDSQIAEFFDHKLDQIYPGKDEFVAALKSGTRLRFYIGADATAPRLHLGHVVPLLKMEQLRKLGHQIIFLIGDFTARIGDPTDKTAARVMLTEDEVTQNAKTFKEQVGKYIDFDTEINPAEIKFNSQWNESLSFSDVIGLASEFTVQQMLERDMFQVRLKENKPIFLHEFFYPLIQGFDSVSMRVDGEFGGRDQTFNMLAGRTLAKSLLGLNKFVLTTHFLLSADGKNKMSKSIGNCIFIIDTPEDKYGKVMAIPDDLIIHYFELATLLSINEINEIKSKLTNGEDPMEVKKQAAFAVVKLHDGDEAAKRAQDFFERTIQKQEAPLDTPVINKESLESLIVNNQIKLKDLVSASKAVQSNTEAKRLIESGAVEVDGNKITDINAMISISDAKLIKIGKRKWFKLS